MIILTSHTAGIQGSLSFYLESSFSTEREDAALETARKRKVLLNDRSRNKDLVTSRALHEP